MARNNTKTGQGKTMQAVIQTANVAKMLSDSIEICRQHGRNDTRTAYGELINFIGTKLGINPDGCQLDPGIIQRLDTTFDIGRFASVLDDHLGHLFTTLEISNASLGQCLTPMSIADMIVAITCRGASAGDKILDPCVGSGVFLIAALKAAPPGVQLYGVEIDRTLYRTALVQLTVFTDYGKKSPFFLLNDDSLMNPSPDWNTANLWTPLN